MIDQDIVLAKVGNIQNCLRRIKQTILSHYHLHDT